MSLKPPTVHVCRHLGVLGALVVVGGVEDLKPTHVTHVAMEIGTVDPIATLSNGSIGTELLPQVFVLQRRVRVKLLDERNRAFPFHRLGCTHTNTH